MAYPLWRQGTLAGSAAEDTASSFLWVILPIVAVPWIYAFRTYVYRPKGDGHVLATGPVGELSQV